MKENFFLYARKSTDTEEKQILSIEAQLAELKIFAEREGLQIKEVLIEHRAPKDPGRPIFNSMMERIEKGEASGIVAWHPDRLARNTVDGGLIVHLLDRKLLQFLKFPTFWFENTPQGKFMLNISFGQSKYFVDNLSENVERGMRQKIRRGEWPGGAPPGYLNCPQTRKVLPDPASFHLAKNLFETYATGDYTVQELQKLTFTWGLA